jgi:organic hydroperoxide reductase OsmC/OhrA
MAAQDKIARAHIEHAENFRFTVTFPDLQRSVPLSTDEDEPLGSGAGPNPAALLAAAVGNCLAASLVFCLRKARVEPAAVSADAAAHVARNEAGRFRIDGIDVELSFSVEAAQQAALERCLPLFEDFGIVTESVRRGVPVRVHVGAREALSVE